jgi:hypothetical protein
MLSSFLGVLPILIPPEGLIYDSQHSQKKKSDEQELRPSYGPQLSIVSWFDFSVIFSHCGSQGHTYPCCISPSLPVGTFFPYLLVLS